MARRTKTLAGLSAVEIDSAMRHREQLENLSAVTSLLEELDVAGSDPGRLGTFQEQLYRATYRAQQAGHDIRRAVSRLKSGKNTGWPVAHDLETAAFVAPPWHLSCEPDCRDSTAWETELRVAERVDRQLKAVGDALAWRVHRYDRRIIIALSRNSPPGPFVGKAGLAYERGAVRDFWEKHQHFALMHDLTSVLRIVDITEVRADGFRMLREIKANPDASVGRQIRLAQEALAATDGSSPLPGSGPETEPFLWRSSAQLRTHIRSLPPLIDQASAHGFWIGRTGDRVAGIVNLLVAAQNGRAPAQQWAEYQGNLEDALRRHLPDSLHRMKAISADLAGRDPAIAPYGIYPMPAWQRAGLICDYLIIEGTMTDRTLITALERRRLATRLLLPAASGHRSAGQNVLEITRRDRSLVLHGAAVNQLLLEWIMTDRYADAIAELLDTEHPSPRGVLTFSNEVAVWR
jgi:hypothetical protein